MGDVAVFGVHVGAFLLFSRICFFFFQAEDGIRDLTVTGVQTCALPIFLIGLNALDMVQARRSQQRETAVEKAEGIEKEDVGITPLGVPMLAGPGAISTRSEERRVGKECRSRWSPYH